MERQTIHLNIDNLDGSITNLYQRFPHPEATKTYMPINHCSLIRIALKKFNGIPQSVSMRLDKTGDKSLTEIRYPIPNFPDLLYTIAMTNSYNKTVPVKLASGIAVMVCFNMQIHGEINYFRKHTPRIWDDIIPAIARVKDHMQEDINDAIVDMNFMQSIHLDDEAAYARLGITYGKGMVDSRVINCALNEWNKPTYEQFKPRTLWSLYNGLTFGMRKSSPLNSLEMQKKVHEYFTGNGIA